MEPIYTLATIADLQVVIDQRILFSDELIGKQEPAPEAQLRQSLRTYFERELNKNYICWYASVDGEVASIGGLVIRTQPPNLKNLTGTWGYVMNVYTAPKHRRKGLSSQILRRLLNTARERGVTAFELHATKEGEPVYVKDGFELHNEPTYRKFIP